MSSSVSQFIVRNVVLMKLTLFGSVLVQSGRKSLSSDPQRRNTDQSHAGLVLSDLQSMAREEGEGMETTETESLSPAITPLTSLEHLLTSPDPKQGTFESRAAGSDVIFFKFWVWVGGFGLSLLS